MHGSADKAITMDQFAGLAQELETAGVAHEMITYGGAQHAFTVFGGSRYQETADKKSWSIQTPPVLMLISCYDASSVVHSRSSFCQTPAE